MCQTKGHYKIRMLVKDKLKSDSAIAHCSKETIVMVLFNISIKLLKIGTAIARMVLNHCMVEQYKIK